MSSYSCVDMPTVQRFMDSDAFMRGLMGPFGSGKSSACAIEIVRRALEVPRGPDGVRRSRWAVVRNCYDDETEILTERRGWQPFAELTPDDKVATLHGEQVIFETPSFHYSAPYDGEMIGIQNEGMDLLVTPDHKLWVTKTFGREQHRTPYRHETAERCYGMIDWRMKRDAVWVGEKPTREGFPDSVAFFEFLGMWFAEGYAGIYHYPGRTSPHYRLIISQKKEVAYLRDLLSRCGLKWGEYDKGDDNFNFVISSTDPVKALIKDLAGCGKAAVKAIPYWVKAADKEHLVAFLHGFLRGDGHFKTGAHDSTQAFTSSWQMADDLQEIVFKAGMVANIRGTDMTSYPMKAPVTGKANSGMLYAVTIVTPKKYEPYTKHGWYRRPYSGMVYCVTVSTHIVYVRRNGVAVWSGQTVKELEDTTERTVLQWLVPQQIGGDWVPSKHNYRIKGLRAPGDEKGADIEIMFRALDRDDQIRDLLSLELTGAWVNEAREINWAIVDALQARVGRFPRRQDVGSYWFGIWADTNPPDVDSDWYKFFEETDHSDAVADLARFIPGLTVETYRGIFKQPSGRAPKAENLRNLADGYYQRLAIGKSQEWTKVYIDGEYGFVTDGKPVWPEYVDQIHCPEDKNLLPRPVLSLPIVRSWDFGLTPACVFSQVTPKGQWIVFDELIATSMGADKFSDEVLNHSARYYSRAEFMDVGDPAGMQKAQTDETTCFNILHAKGIGIEAGLQTLSIRIESVSKPLRTLVDGRPQFVLHPRCKKLRRAMMGGYHFRKMRVSGERYTATPEKDSYSHVADALGYAGTRLFGASLYQQDNRQSRDDSPGAGMGRSRTTGY